MSTLISALFFNRNNKRIGTREAERKDQRHVKKSIPGKIIKK